MNYPASQTVRRRALFQEMMAAHCIDRTVIVTGSFRAGTSFVCSLLGANGMAGIRAERFSKLVPLAARPEDEALGSQLDQIFSTAANGLFVTKIMWPHRNALARVLGFERDDSAALAKIFPRARWINVIRRDKLGQAVSYWKAKETDRWQQMKAHEVSSEPDYDFERIRACFVELAAHDMLWQDFHARAGTDVRHIVYEDFVERVVTDLPSLLDWLDGHRLETGPIKTASPLKQQRNGHSDEMRERFLADLYRTGF
ncbi:Stf0 family sulfotransferase [Paracoccus versutus]|uniref:Stf0 family sulfotransferase n=1 Tax=Paracoccus versutus TaxID=34007 RepID=UPI001FB6832A|nr:Stf0 family sulfotransferase [Paracoccus versutus]MCJ1903260.1 Stf0 family sulfotransferase [Paracoccus versutus]